MDDHVSRSAYVTFTVESPPNGSRLETIMNQTGEKDISFLIWTTTPWTIPANMVCSHFTLPLLFIASYTTAKGIAVNTDMEYSVVRLTETTDRPSKVVIAGSELLESVQSVLGPVETLGTLSGMLRTMNLRVYASNLLTFN